MLVETRRGEVEVTEFPRQEFLAERWQYRAGQHVTILAPTDGGKTQLGFELLEWCATPALPCVSLVKKPWPKDDTVRAWSKKLDFKTVHTWPPPVPPKLAYPKPTGWTVWPKKVGRDIRLTNERCAGIFQRAIEDCYHDGKRILFCDEVAGLVRLGLTPELETIWMEARSAKCGLWAATQRPSGIPLAAYSQSSHLFMGLNPDERDMKRYAEIGGVDPKLVFQVVASLQLFEFLYIKRRGRTGPEMCIVLP